ncbi:MAG TPA: Rieske 2Fe-2S domain-containing protein [Vicinamibacterales bacterium]|nr:Rieske 2Fe-2S domain-containing protein [Vicinamibacterales bacterium]
MGELLRRYWMPALLSEEVPERDGPPVRVRLLGEDLIAFRGTDGHVGLVDAFCPHRRAPMFFGRNEECGLRCVYHGWKFDRTGTCVDMPSEPPDSLFKTKVTITAYPTCESAGIVWAYLGPPAQKPAEPDFEVCRVPATHRYTTKVLQEDNFMQALEGGVDSVHTTFLHRDDIHEQGNVRTKPCEDDIDFTDYGFAGASINPLDDGRTFTRAHQFVMPIHSIRGVTTDRFGVRRPVPAIAAQLFVPIDDYTCWMYSYQYSYLPEIPFGPEYRDPSVWMIGRFPTPKLPGYRLAQNMRNDYQIDRKLQKTTSYSGIYSMTVQDVALQEGMGPICDRSKEHLAHSDRVIIALRRLLFEGMDAVARGEAPRALDPAVYRTLRATDTFVPAGKRWQDYLKDELVARF